MVNRRRTQPELDGLVLDMDLSLSLPTVNRGRVGNQSLLDVHGTVHGRPAGAFVSAGNDVAYAATPLIGTGDFVLSFWQKKAFATGGQIIVSQYKSGDAGRFLVQGLATGRLSFQLGAASEITTDVILGDDVWTHVVLCYDASETSVNVYINGAFVETLTDTFGTMTQDAVAKFRVGAGNDIGTVLQLDGLVRNVVLYNGITCDAVDAKHIYDGYRISGQTLTGEWLFYEGTGGTVSDTSGSATDLTVFGMGWDVGTNGGDLNLTAAGRMFQGV